MTKATDFMIGGTAVSPGSRVTIDLPMARLYTHNEITLPVHVVHGRRAGPVFLSVPRFMAMKSMVLRSFAVYSKSKRLITSRGLCWQFRLLILLVLFSVPVISPTGVISTDLFPAVPRDRLPDAWLICL